jgi:hypothetical protein
MTETEIVQELKVDQSTISQDIKALKALSQRFLFDLASERDGRSSKVTIMAITPKDKLLALKIIKECNEVKFALFKEGPSIMNIKSLEEITKY